MTKQEDFYTASEVAKKLGISKETLNIYDNKGIFNPTLTIGGHRRYDKQEIDNYIGSYIYDDYLKFTFCPPGSGFTNDTEDWRDYFQLVLEQCPPVLSYYIEVDLIPIKNNHNRIEFNNRNIYVFCSELFAICKFPNLQQIPELPPQDELMSLSEEQRHKLLIERESIHKDNNDAWKRLDIVFMSYPKTFQYVKTDSNREVVKWGWNCSTGYVVDMVAKMPWERTQFKHIRKLLFTKIGN